MVLLLMPVFNSREGIPWAAINSFHKNHELKQTLLYTGLIKNIYFLIPRTYIYDDPVAKDPLYTDLFILFENSKQSVK